MNIYYKLIISISFFLLFIFWTFLGWTQSVESKRQTEADSLEAMLKTTSSPKEKVNIYNSLAAIYNASDSAKVARFTSQAIALAKKINYPEGQSNALYHWGLTMTLKEHYATSLKYLESAEQVAQKAGDKKGVANAWYGLAKMYYHQGKLALAIKKLEKTLQVFAAVMDPPNLADCYYELGRVFFDHRKYDRAIRTLHKGIEVAEAIGDNLRTGSMYLEMGVDYGIQGYYTQALRSYQIALKRFKKAKNKRGIVYSYGNLADTYMHLGNYSKALDMMKVLRQYKEVDYLGEGEIYLHLGNYPQALKNFQKSLKMAEEKGEEETVAHCYEYIGMVYQKQANYSQALKMHQEALKIRKNLGDTGYMAHSYNYIGDIYKSQGLYTKAQEMFQQSLKFHQQTAYKSGIATVYLNLGTLALAQKQKKEAKAYFEEALVLRQEMGERDMSAEAWVQLGVAYYIEKRFADAQKHLTKGLNIARKTSNPVTVRDGAEYLFKVYKRTNQPQKALENHILFKQMTDSLLNEKNIRQVTQLEERFGAQKREDSLKLIQSNERKVLTAEINTQKANRRAALIGIGLLVLLLTLLGWFLVVQRRGKRKLGEALDQLVGLDYFKQQMLGMIVHDLKNPLNSIIGLSERNNKDARLMAINQSGKRMHNLVMNILDVQRIEDKQMPLDKTVTPVRVLVDDALSQIGFIAQEKNLQIKINTLPNASLEVDPVLLTRVMVNLLTNASKYTPQNQEILISVEEVDHYCKISVKDTGIGIAPEFLDKVFDKFAQSQPQHSGLMPSTGLGLTFCKLVVEAHGGNIGVNSSLGKGSTFWFSLPIVSHPAPMVTEVLTVASDGLAPLNEFNFTSEELAILQPVIAEINKYEIYQTGNILKLLRGMEDSSEMTLNNWKLALEDALLAFNEERIRELLAQPIQE